MRECQKECGGTRFLETTNKEEKTKMISSLISNTASGQSSMPTEYLLLWKVTFRKNWQIYSTSLS